MKVLTTTTYRDGGTIKLETTEGVFWKDNRISSTTKGRFYRGDFPGKDKSRILEDEDYEKNLYWALEVYQSGGNSNARVEPATMARHLITKFSYNNKIDISLAQLSAKIYIELILEQHVTSINDVEYWKEVEIQLNNKKLTFKENPEIDHVN